VQEKMTGVNLDNLSVDEAADRVAEFKKINRQVEKRFEADLRKRRAEEKKKEAKKAKKDTEQTESPAEGNGHGGSAIANAPSPHFA
jgi:hypothetical protein